MKKLMWIGILLFVVIVVFSLTENVSYKRAFTMQLNEFDEKFHTKLENKKFHCAEYANSSGYKVSYYCKRKFYDEPFRGIEITDFKNGFDIIDYNSMEADYELTETFKKIEIPIKIKIGKSIIDIKSKFNLGDIHYGISLIYQRIDPEDIEIEKAIERMFQTIDEYIVIEE